MGFFSRLSTLVKANANAAIDKLEDPQKVLDQLIIEMHEQLIEAKKAVAIAIADQKKLERSCEEQRVQAQEWERKAMFAVQQGRDDLAREALLRKQEYDSAFKEYKKQLDMQTTAVDKLKDSLRVLQSKIEESQRQKNLLLARAKRADAQKKIQATVSSVAGNRTAFEAFDRMKAKVDQMEAEADASSELEDISANANLDKQFAALEQSDGSADAMLLELKQKMGALPSPSSESDQQQQSKKPNVSINVSYD
ncbi:MAG: PspA/IM30 family protein [Treponema sp.]|jgi:phage shock protein A|nr:PspA/IM30 family protein [Treponema sp.]